MNKEAMIVFLNLKVLNSLFCFVEHIFNIKQSNLGQ